MTAGNTLLNPHSILNGLEIEPGMHVAEFGPSRTGHVILPLANAVTAEGRVYAVDLVPAVLSMVGARANLHGHSNVCIVRGDFERCGGVDIPESSLDYAFSVNNLWCLQRPKEMIKEFQRLLKPTGRVVLVDWEQTSDHLMAPSREHRLNPALAEALFRRHKCFMVDSIDVGNNHWALVFAFA
ncbi:MAG: methyltransferase domain-containing protein [Candidatus Uhrbacteria bacterium]|nr:methyltransferase domain-containing protein [Candidatus Uhrbacteria bacterium]